MNVVAELRAHGVKGEHIARVLACSRGSVSLWKYGKRRPSQAKYERLLALAKVVGIERDFHPNVQVAWQQAQAAA